MERRGDRIYFNERDRNRFGELPDVLPATDVPAIYKLATDRCTEALSELRHTHRRHDIYGMPEDQHRAALQAVTLRKVSLELLQEDLIRCAFQELAAECIRDLGVMLAEQPIHRHASNQERAGFVRQLPVTV